jgi:hypothetical protein
MNGGSGAGLHEQLLGDLLFIDDLSRHGIDHPGHLSHYLTFRSSQSQIHRSSDSPTQFF